MNAAHFLYKQIQALPDKERMEFAMLWEESKKQYQPPKQKVTRHHVHTVEEAYEAVMELFNNRKLKKQQKL